MPPRVCSITVAYDPDPQRLAAQVAALHGQVDEIVVVDNGSAMPVASLPGLHAARVVALGANRGVAGGFNAGLAAARAGGAEHVLLLDDDSVPAPGMVAALLAALGRGRQAPGSPRVAAVGPRIADARDAREYPFVRLGWTHNRHVRCAAGDEVVACDFLISSGSLIPLEALRALGEFDEALFVDSVDLEWCCRARDRGWSLFGACAASLDHRLGERRRKVLGTIELVVHPPERLYYMTRNRLLLYGRPYMPLKWKLKDAGRALAKFAATMLFLRPRLEYARMTARAIRDAAAGRGGKRVARGGDR